MFRLWHKWQDRERLAVIDATILIARCGARASHIASRRVSQMRSGIIFDSNRPPCHWKRVHSIIRKLLPYDGDDEEEGGPAVKRGAEEDWGR
jgi:hypothetical protein